MKTRNIIHIILAIVIAFNIALMFALDPFAPAFFAVSFLWKAFYIAMMCGWPVLILIPIAILLLPIAAIPNKHKTFRDRYMNLTSYTFLVASLLIFLLNSSMVIAKYVFGSKIFTKELYADIKGTNENTDDLRNGHFRDQFSSISRQDTIQLETNLKTGRTTEYSVKWLSASEYRLVKLTHDNNLNNDTLYVRITTNLPDRYDCYLKFGKYAQSAVVYKE